MKKALQYIGFALMIFILLTMWDLFSGRGTNPSANALESLFITFIYFGFDYYQNRKKDAQ